MNTRAAILLVVGATSTFVLWELAGHVFLMDAPMAIRHVASGGVGILLSLVIAAVSVHAIVRQQAELRELARLRDYLVAMEAHYLRLPPAARRDPRQHFEAQATAKQFVDAEKRFSFREPLVRAHAAAELVTLAGRKLPDVGGRAREPGATYPYFGRAATHLAAALYLETESRVRAEVLRSLEDLQSLTDNDHVLAFTLVSELAHANRTALALYLDALAACWATMERRHAPGKGERSDAEEMLAALMRFTPKNPAIDFSTLRDLVAAPRFKSLVAEWNANESAGAMPGTIEVDSLSAAAQGAVALHESSLALASALRSMRAQDTAEGERLASRKPVLPLSKCFLARADLAEACLEQADLEDTVLAGAKMERANLSYANLTRAILRDASLQFANLDHAGFWEARLQGASFTGANLTHANLGRADLSGAYLSGARLQSALLWETAVVGAPLLPAANFTDADWWNANFTDPLSGKTDNAIRGWLQATYGRQAA